LYTENVGTTEKEVKDLTSKLQAFKKENNLTAFSKKTKRSASTNGGNQTGSNSRQKGNNGTALRQLEGSGYVVVPNVLETDGGTWELISKVYKMPFSYP
jgi:hypothetical protein